MKPLPIKEQIKILRKVLWTQDIIYGMCTCIAEVATDLGHTVVGAQVPKIIPTLNHCAYSKFYLKIKTVQKRNNQAYWDSPTIFGNLRRRWFIRHLIKELKKQL